MPSIPFFQRLYRNFVGRSVTHRSHFSGLTFDVHTMGPAPPWLWITESVADRKKALKEASWFRQVSFLFFLVNICCGSCLLSVMRLLGSRQIVSITERLTGAISSGISLIHRSICHIPASTSRLLSKENDQHCTRISKSRGVIRMRLTCNESTVWEGVCHVDIPNPRFAWLPHDGAKAFLLR